MRTMAVLAALLLIPACGKDDGEDTSAGGSASGTGTDSNSSTGGGPTGGTGGTRGTDGGSGASGASGSAGTGGGQGCTRDEDCKLFTDCCECKAVLTSEDPASCDTVCDQTTCETWGARGVACRDGACVIAPINCDDSMVSCDGPTPECADGFSPVVNEDGSCWTGQCAPNELCG